MSYRRKIMEQILRHYQGLEPIDSKCDASLLNKADRKKWMAYL